MFIVENMFLSKSSGPTSRTEFRVDELTSCEQETFCWAWHELYEEIVENEQTGVVGIVYFLLLRNVLVPSIAEPIFLSIIQKKGIENLSFLSQAERSCRKRRCLVFCIPSGTFGCSHNWDDCKTKKYFFLFITSSRIIYLTKVALLAHVFPHTNQ